MISQDDIDAFAEDNAEAIKAAAEYARRGGKGIPSDRFAGSANAEKLVARGIWAMGVILDSYRGNCEALLAETQNRGRESMALHKST